VERESPFMVPSCLGGPPAEEVEAKLGLLQGAGKEMARGDRGTARPHPPPRNAPAPAVSLPT
jgi:hypothetical protein